MILRTTQMVWAALAESKARREKRNRGNEAHGRVVTTLTDFSSRPRKDDDF
jgi:hypothetical protein